MKKITNFFFLAATCFMANVVFSQPGTLDTTFGTDGKVSNNFGQNNVTYDSKLQSDGKILVVGNTFSTAPGSSFLVTRYLPNGDLDSTFGTLGFVTTLFGNHCSAHAVAIQDDGKIVVAGNTYPTAGTGSDSNIMVVRYTKAGTLDLTFAENGIRVLNIPSNQSINSILLQENGNIILGGSFTHLDNPNADTFGLVRFMSDGTLDATFGENGYVYTPTIPRGEILDMKFIDGEDIIAVGRRHIISKYLMVRYTSDGQVVNSFGSNNNGIVEVAYNNNAQLNKLAISADNNLFIAGSTFNNIKYNGFITKYNANGIIDSTFGTNGIILRDFGNTSTGISKSSFANDICIDLNNNLIVGYSVGSTNDYDFGLESYSLSGVVNPNFGINGYFTTNFGEGHEYFSTMLIQQDNKIVMSGSKGLQVVARVNNSEFLSSNSFIKKIDKVKVSPNPFNNFDILELEIRKTGSLNVDLLNFNGMLISTLITNKVLSLDKNIEKLNLSDLNLASGIYLLKVRLDNESFEVVKIIKN